MITHFDSIGEYFSFVFAREFWDKQNNQTFAYSKSSFEKAGEWLTKPILGFADFTFKNIKNPLFITALVIIGIAAASIAFYPAQFIAVVGFVYPPLLHLTPSVGKFALYLALNTTIVGLFIRTMNRLSPSGNCCRSGKHGMPAI